MSRIIVDSAKIISKGQITIPKDIRELKTAYIGYRM